MHPHTCPQRIASGAQLCPQPDHLGRRAALWKGKRSASRLTVQAAKQARKSKSSKQTKTLEKPAQADQDNDPPAPAPGSGPGPGPEDDKSFNLDDFNPLSMGRRSRRIFDDVWTQFAQLASPLGSRTEEDLDLTSVGGVADTFDTPEAPTTRVLVVGATGRIGRVLIRKLLLRGYTVSALVRDGTSHGLPQSVTVFQGDVRDYDSCRRALQGVDKVCYCAGARTNLLVDQKTVGEDGVQLVASAFQDVKNQNANKGKLRATTPETAKRPIAVKDSFQQWKVTGLEEEEDEGWGMSGQKVKKWARSTAQRNQAHASLNHRKSLVFEGSLVTRGSHASVGCDLPVNQGKPLLANCEGITMRVAGEGQPYTFEITTGQGHRYSARFVPASTFTNVRLPFNTFRAVQAGAPDFDAGDAVHIGIRREGRTPDTVLGRWGDNGKVETDSVAAGAFRLEVLRIKALPGGQESDFILVSCAGRAATDPDSAMASEKAMAVKRAGEACLQRTGLGYTIVRPAELINEPGGYKALLFDQGNRIRAGISCVDVADVLLRSLHNPAARNTTFEVAHEATAPLGIGGYELVAHLPDKSSDYLGPALASMQKNM